MKQATRPPLRRLLYIDQSVRRRKYPSAKSLAAELEVSLRTVRRDIEFLRYSWGAPIGYCPVRKGYHYTEADYSLPLLKLSEGELLALVLAGVVMEQYRHSSYATELSSAFGKITAAFTDELTIDLSHWKHSFAVRGPVADTIEPELIRSLHRSLNQRVSIQLDYWSAARQQITTRTVDPYGITIHGGDSYLVAYCHLRNDIRMFTLGRIRKLVITDHSFEVAQDFDMEDYLQGSFRTIRGEGETVTVRARFASTVAHLIREKVWHPTQSLEEMSDGSLILSVEVNHFLELRRWLMSYGSECEVLEPAELRKEISEEIKQMTESYG